MIVIQSLVGIIVVAIVRPKSRNADIIAGLFVGATIWALLYLSFFSIVPDAGIQRDLELIRALGEQIEMDPEHAIILAKTYPEISQLKPAQQIQFLGEKAKVEEIIFAPRRVWSAVLLAWACTVPSTLIETMIAGYWIRRMKSEVWALVKSVEISAPFCAMHTILCTYLGLLMMYGNGRGIGNRWAPLVIGVVALLLFFSYRGWSWWKTVPLQVIWVVFMIGFMRYDLPNSQIVSQAISDSERFQTTARDSGVNDGLIESQRANGDALLQIGKADEALPMFQLAASWLAQNQDSSLDQKLELDHRIALAMSALNRDTEALQVRKTIASSSANVKYANEFFRLCNRLGKSEEGKTWLGMIPFGTVEDWMAFANCAAAYVDNLEDYEGKPAVLRLQVWRDIMREKVKFSSLAQDLKEHLNDWIDHNQNWRVSSPIPVSLAASELESLEGKDRTLEKNSSSWPMFETNPAVAIRLRNDEGKDEKRVRIALAHVHSTFARPVRMLVASNTNVQLFINSKRILPGEDRKFRSMHTQQFHSDLGQGQNTLILEISDADGESEFSCLIVDERDQPIVLDWGGGL